MNASKQLIYDEYCPLCRWYSSRFIRFGILKPEERLSFSDARRLGILDKLETDKARNEIPLYLPNAGIVLYGTDSLVYLLNLKFPGIKRIYRIPPFRSLAKLMYRFISYNRRVMAIESCTGNACESEPTLNKFYRTAYILFTALIAMVITLAYGKLFAAQNLIVHPFAMLLMCGGGWLLSLAAGFIRLSGRRRWDYFGHLSTTMLVGVLLLLPAITINQYQPDFISVVICTLISFATMLNQIRLRMRVVGLSLKWIFLWVAALLVSFTIPFLIQNL